MRCFLAFSRQWWGRVCSWDFTFSRWRPPSGRKRQSSQQKKYVSWVICRHTRVRQLTGTFWTSRNAPLAPDRCASALPHGKPWQPEGACMVGTVIGWCVLAFPRGSFWGPVHKSEKSIFSSVLVENLWTRMPIICAVCVILNNRKLLFYELIFHIDALGAWWRCGRGRLEFQVLASSFQPRLNNLSIPSGSGNWCHTFLERTTQWIRPSADHCQCQSLCRANMHTNFLHLVKVAHCKHILLDALLFWTGLRITLSFSLSSPCVTTLRQVFCERLGNDYSFQT